MKIPFKLPRPGMNMEETTVTAWHKQAGESVDNGEPLYSIEFDKAATGIEAPIDGTVLEVLVPVGTTVAVGTELCRFEKSPSSPP